MTKEEMLDVIRLLSALESWGLSLKDKLPEFIYDDLNKSMAVLYREILK